MQLNFSRIAAIAVLAALCCTGASAQVAPSLGAAQSFAVLSGTTVTNTGATLISGDLGVSPGTAVTGFPPGVVVSGTIHSADALAAQAQSAVTAAYNNLASQACTANLTGQDLGGLTLTPGVYCFDAAAQLTGALTLDAQSNSNAVFIFRTGSTLNTASGSSVVVINGGPLLCNVFWQIGSSATLGSNSRLLGNVLAQSSITATTGAAVVGRALARGGAVTLDTNDVAPTCASPVVCPTITLSPATLPNGTVAVAYTQTIVGSGGTAPYTFDVTAGVLPVGMTLTPGGILSGTPTTAGTTVATIRGRDANSCPATRSYSVTIVAVACPEITLTPATLPNGVIAVAYSQTLVASGGTGPYTYDVTAGALPAGMTLSAAGVLSGTPTTAGTAVATIRARDANSCPVTREYSVTVTAAACPEITLTPATLPNGVIAVAYSQTLAASGGTAPYTFDVTAGVLPAGMTLTPGGVLAGTPTTAGTSIVTIRARDANSCPATRPYTMTITAVAMPACPVIVLTPATLPNGRVAVAYSQAIVASGGTAPYTYSLAAGVMPVGLTLSAAGVVSGTPTVAAESTFAVRGTDVNGCFATIPYTMTVDPVVVVPPNCPAITLTPPTLPDGTVNVAYSQTIVGNGGTGPYRFGVTAGTLPVGMTLTVGGVLSGTPTAAGRSTFTVRGTDANGCFAEIPYTMSLVTAVPTLPQAFAILLALSLAAAGYLRLRRGLPNSDK